MLAACLPCVKGGAFRTLHSDGRRTKALLSPQGLCNSDPARRVPLDPHAAARRDAAAASATRSPRLNAVPT
jgi:hypothetical protein